MKRKGNITIERVKPILNKPFYRVLKDGRPIYEFDKLKDAKIAKELEEAKYN